ncbi:MAG: hypothetical protein VXZ39_06515, partial [Planctomycetota bacterium]|nr:hypothetical protein [Planctomycetota bacterium]
MRKPGGFLNRGCLRRLLRRTAEVDAKSKGKRPAAAAPKKPSPPPKKKAENKTPPRKGKLDKKGSNLLQGLDIDESL